MSIELKIEIVGAAVFGQTGKSWVALLLGQGNHGGEKEHLHRTPVHRPLLALDADAVTEVHDVPALLVATKKHRSTGVIDMTGLDLLLKDKDLEDVVLDQNGGFPFDNVVALTNLVDPAEIDARLTHRSSAPSNDKLVTARLFLDSGRLAAGAPHAPYDRDMLWEFKPAPKLPRHYRLTNRTIFRCRLDEEVLSFQRAGKAGPTVRLRPPERGPLNVRITCFPAPEGGSFYPGNEGSHFHMTYQLLATPPPPHQEPIPQRVPPAEPRAHYPATDCFNQGRARIATDGASSEPAKEPSAPAANT